MQKWYFIIYELGNITYGESIPATSYMDAFNSIKEKYTDKIGSYIRSPKILQVVRDKKD